MVAICMHHMDSYAVATAAPYIPNIGLTVVANLQGPCSIVRMFSYRPPYCTIYITYKQYASVFKTVNLPFLPMFLSHHKRTQRCLHLHRSSLPVCQLHHHFQGLGCNKHVYIYNANKYHHNSSFSRPFHMLVCYRDTDCKNCSCTGAVLLSTILLPKYVYGIRGHSL